MRVGKGRLLQNYLPCRRLVSITLFLLCACTPNSIDKDLQATPSLTSSVEYSKQTHLSPLATQISHNTPTPIQGVVDNGGIPVEQDSLIPPIPPAQVRANRLDEGIELRWQGTGSDIVIHYVIYRRPLNVEKWEIIGIVPVQNENQGEYMFHDPGPDNWSRYEYAVAVVDLYDNESILSETAALEANP